MTLLAHAGHWLAGLVFIVPIVAIGVLVLVGNRREKRRKRAATSLSTIPTTSMAWLWHATPIRPS